MRKEYVSLAFWARRRRERAAAGPAREQDEEATDDTPPEQEDCEQMDTMPAWHQRPKAA